MQWVSNHSVDIIFVAFSIHLLMFIGLVLFRKREVLRLRSHLADILGPKFRRTSTDPDRTIDEAIDGFFHDIREVLSTGKKDKAAGELSQRLLTKDEERKYLRRRWFETVYSVVRTGIEAYPLAGILGTVLAIGVGLNTAEESLPTGGQGSAMVQPAGGAHPTTAPAAERGDPASGAADAASASAGAIVGNFKNAIWSTVWGLVFGLFFMLLNAWFEPGFERLSEHRNSIRDVVRAGKIVLLQTPEGPEA